MSELLMKQERLGWFHLATFRIHDRFILKDQISAGSSGFILGLHSLLTKAQYLSWLDAERNKF